MEGLSRVSHASGKFVLIEDKLLSLLVSVTKAFVIGHKNCWELLACSQMLAADPDRAIYQVIRMFLYYLGAHLTRNRKKIGGFIVGMLMQMRSDARFYRGRILYWNDRGCTCSFVVVKQQWIIYAF